MTQPRTLYLDRPGGRIAYDVRGAGPLVVCVPGLGDLRGVYRFLVPVLVEAGYRVATMDLRGHGDSDATFTAYDTVASGGDVAALVEHLGGPALLVGGSLGAGAAAWAAAERPDAVAGLVLIGPFVRDVPVPAYLRLALRVGLAGPWGRPLWAAYLRSLYPSRRPADLPGHLAAVRAGLRRPAHWRAFKATTRTSHAPVEARLGEVAAPTLVVMGERDADFPDPAAEAQLVAERLHPHALAEILMVAGAGHYPQAEHPEAVIPAVLGLAGRVLRRA